MGKPSTEGLFHKATPKTVTPNQPGPALPSSLKSSLQNHWTLPSHHNCSHTDCIYSVCTGASYPSGLDMAYPGWVHFHCIRAIAFSVVVLIACESGVGPINLQLEAMLVKGSNAMRTGRGMRHIYSVCIYTYTTTATN